MTLQINGYIINNEFVSMNRKISKHRLEKLRKKMQAQLKHEIYFVKQTRKK
jgi:hypothetical protein